MKQSKQRHWKSIYSYVGLRNKVITLASATGDAENAAWDFLISTSEEHSEHTKRSNFLASSMVMPTQAGWYLQGKSKHYNKLLSKWLGIQTQCIEIQGMPKAAK